MNKVRAMFLGDVHMGISNTSHLYEELMNIVPKTIEERGINIVFIPGDYHDKELVGSHKYYATKFMGELAKICDEKGIALRLIKGTKSHDHNQLVGLYNNIPILLPDLDFKIINTVEEEELMGLKILYIPEEELENQVEYYEPYINKKYNIIVGHGTWDFVNNSWALMKYNEIGVIGSPVFLTKEWDSAIEEGFVVFGHIHDGPTHNNKYFYTRSFSRWVYGIEEAPGFLVSETDLETKEYKVEFIENTMAPKYNEITFESLVGDGGLGDKSVIEVRKAMRGLLEKGSIDRFKINVTDLTPPEITLLQKAARTLDNIDLNIVSKKTVEALLEDAEGNAIDDYVIHPDKHGLTKEDVIIKFAKDTNDDEISMGDLIDAISDNR